MEYSVFRWGKRGIERTNSFFKELGIAQEIAENERGKKRETNTPIHNLLGHLLPSLPISMEHLQAQHDSTGNLPINELPVMGFILHLRKEFWDRHGAKIATC